MQVLALLLPFLLSTFDSKAQNSLYLRHQSWSTEDGLPQNSVHQVLQADDGYIWVATEGGLARFDGVGFRIFRHLNTPAFVSDDVCCLANDGEGNLWVATEDGLLRWHSRQWERFGEREGLPSTSIKALASTGQSLLILAGNSLVEWKEGRFTSVADAPGGIRGLEAAGDGGVWLLMDGPAVLWHGVVGATHWPSGLRDFSPVIGVARGLNGTVWSFSEGMVMMTEGASTRRWKVGSDLPGSRVESLFVDRDGAAWVGTNDGLAMLSKESSVAATVASLKGNSVLQTMEDQEGNYWIGTETSGLHIFRRLKFRTEPGLADKALTAVVQATDGAVWVGTRADGLRRLREGKVDQPADPASLTSPVILSLAPGLGGSVWVGTPDGLNQVVATGKVRQITSADGLPDDYIQSLAAQPDGSVWVGTRHGLVHFQSSKVEILTTLNGLSGDLIGALFSTHEGEVWVGTSGGLCRISKGKITAFTSSDGLPQGIVTAITQDSTGALWIATQGIGLSRFAQGVFRQVRSPAFAGSISGMNFDRYGSLWLRDEQGIERVPLSDLNACVEQSQKCAPRIQRYGASDGLPTSEMVSGRSPVMWRMSNGELWFVTRRGAAIADPEHLPLNTVAPPVAVERFLVDETSADTARPQIEVAPGHVRYTMEYAALSFTAPSEVRYRFRLEGLDQQWTEAGSRRSATYTNLPARSYTFRVQAMNNDGVWNEAGASLRFRVVPPLYRRWWFIVLVLLSLAGLSAGLYRLRLRRLQMRFDAVLQERNRVAREIHDTLAQDFVGVSVQLDIVSQLLGSKKVEAALQQVQQTRSLVTDGLADARRSIWELRANLTQDSLPARLTKAVERYSTETLKVRLRIGGAFRRLESRIQDEILRIAQEALSNVQRHSDASAASVALLYGEDMLVLTVEDDGRGFSVADAVGLEGHYGLSGMKERAALLGSDLQVVSGPGEGTKIVLSIPIAGAKEK